MLTSLISLLGTQLAIGAPGLVELFEGPTASWQQPADPGGTRIVAQQRVRVARHEESAGAERIRFQCQTGYSGVFLYPIGQAPVLEDFRLSLDYLGDRAGTRLAVRVVFPRARMPDRDEPLTCIVRGEARYESPGQWSTLEVAQLPRLVKRHVRLLRTEHQLATLDEREAYVDSIALIVPGGPQGAEFLIERLTLDGVVSPDVSVRNGAMRNNDAPPGERSLLGKPRDTDSEVTPVDIRLTSSGFREGPTPFFPRVCSSHGEAFETLAKLGFNTVGQTKVPLDEDHSQAAKHRLRLIAPPPTSEITNRHLQTSLAWIIPEAIDEMAIDTVRPQMERIREAPSLASRPLLAAPVHGFASWSRLTDGLVLDAGGAELAGVDVFATAQTQALPGRPNLARIRLDYSAETRSQLQAFAPVGKARRWRSADAIEPAVWRAVAAGAKGIWLDSDSPLGGPGEHDQSISAVVELLNLKLSLVEPWLVGGEPAGQVLGRDRKPVASIFQRGRTRLVVGHRRETARQEIVIPGVSETALAYRVTPAGVAPLKRRRTLGGVSVEAPALGPGSFVLLTDDRRAARDIHARLARTARRAINLQQEILLDELAEFELALAGAQPSVNLTGVTPAVTRQISRAKASASSGDLLDAYLAADRGRQLLRSAEREYRQWLKPAAQLDSSPLTHLTATWSDELRLRQLLRALPRAGNLIAGGDFEELEQVRRSGWRHTQLGQATTKPMVELSPEAPAHGGSCLRITGQAGNSTSRPSAWITSPATEIAAGQLVEITGWIRLERETENHAALAIVDTLGGEELAIVVDTPGDWRPFRLLRRPVKTQDLQVKFALSGVGTASIDAVMIRPITLVTPRLETAEEVQAAGDTDYRK